MAPEGEQFSTFVRCPSYLHLNILPSLILLSYFFLKHQLTIIFLDFVRFKDKSDFEHSDITPASLFTVSSRFYLHFFEEIL